MITYVRCWQSLQRPQRGLLLLLAIAVALANVRQPYPAIAPLQHIPTVLLLIAAPPLLRRWPLSTKSIVLLGLFFLLHTLAGRYTYSNVPYDAWARAILGRTVSGTFGLVRNDFDRLVHLAFGLLWIRPFAEAARRHAGVSGRVSLCMAFLFVGAFSALYEIFEWLLTIVLAPGMADDYNGQQGDVWDSQKDMAAAIVGAAISAAYACFRSRSARDGRSREQR